MLVTLAEPIVPLSLPIVHCCPDGRVPTVAAYCAPLASAVGNWKLPLAVTVTASPPLFSSFTDRPEPRPATVPPTE